MNTSTHIAQDSLQAQWQTHGQDSMGMHPVASWDIDLSRYCWCGGHLKLSAPYIHCNEDKVWKRIHEIQRGEYRHLLAPLDSGVRGILLDAWHLLQYMRLHREIDELYRLLFGTVAAELSVPHAPGDRGRAVAKLVALEVVIMQQKHDEDRLQFWADI